MELGMGNALKERLEHKLQFECEKIRMLFLESSKENIYASSREIELKKRIRRTLEKDFERLSYEKQMSLLQTADLIEKTYAEYIETKPEEREWLSIALKVAAWES